MTQKISSVHNIRVVEDILSLTKSFISFPPEGTPEPENGKVLYSSEKISEVDLLERGSGDGLMFMSSVNRNLDIDGQRIVLSLIGNEEAFEKMFRTLLKRFPETFHLLLEIMNSILKGDTENPLCSQN